MVSEWKKKTTFSLCAVSISTGNWGFIILETIEPPSVTEKLDLDYALKYFQHKDTSLKVKLDPDSGQTVLCGLGEFHIEIIHDKNQEGIWTGNLSKTSPGSIPRDHLNVIHATDPLDRTLGEKSQVIL